MLRPLLSLLFALHCLIHTAPARADGATDMRALLDELVAIDTSNPPGNEEAAAKAVAAHLKAAGLDSQILPFAPGRANLVARLKGDGSKRPLLLVAHLDVVGAKGQPWTLPPFKVTEKNGWLYGRGVLDDKSWAAAAATLLIELHKSHAKLHRDLVFMLNGDEESGGSGIRHLIAHHRELLDGVEFALNEGGGITLDEAGKPRIVNLGTAEKTFANFTLTTHGTGGHSSVPTPDNAIYRLAAALTRTGAYTFPAHLTPTLRETLRAAATTQPPARAQAMRAAADVKGETIPPSLLLAIDDFPYTRALTRTTCVATLADGGTRDNALPVAAHANVNCRILPVESIRSTEETLRKLGGPDVEVALADDHGIGPDVPVTGPVRDAVTKATRAVLGPDVTVVARIGLGASDSRFLRQIGIAAYGIGLVGKPEELLRNPHGPDEGAPAASFPTGYKFLSAIVKELAL